ncbi:MAG: dGTP triphosphohydrolase [Salinivirgaceae bacterium]|jgi:dGTPase|nr:dNTP triphosphohydrolase [Bacteroidales bacterium]
MNLNWETLLNANRFGDNHQTTASDFRSQFQRDYDRLIFSPEFRKLQSKTQVFPLPGEIFVHNRLTHSLEVASVGRSIASLVAEYLANNNLIESRAATEMPTIVATACLAHDMGNPPFGHSGENTLSSFFTDGKGYELKNLFTKTQWADLNRFEGNANVLRLLTHQFYGRRVGGFALTYATLGTIIKYPYSSTAGKTKYGYFDSETDAFNLIVNETGLNINNSVVRHPLVYLVEAADDISYLIMDIEDAHRLGIIDTKTVFNYLLPFLDQHDKIKQKFQQQSATLIDSEKIAYLRSVVINILVNNCYQIFIKNYALIMSGRFEGSLANKLSDNIKPSLDNCKQLGINKIYNDSGVTKLEISGHRILSTLLQCYVEAVIEPQKPYSNLLLSTVPEQYYPTGTLYEKIRLVIDFLSSMTDIQAVKLYRELMGIDIPQRSINN